MMAPALGGHRGRLTLKLTALLCEPQLGEAAMWSFGDILEAVADSVHPEAPAFIHGERTLKWPDAMTRMRNLAGGLRALGLRRGDKVAFYMQNRPEYGELAGATFLGALVHVNVNYRYRAEEIAYILDNADAAALVYSSAFRPIVDEVRSRLPKLRLFVEIGEEAAPFAVRYEEIASGGGAAPDFERSSDDLVFTFTGGTTGLPKAVMYRQGDLAPYLLASSRVFGEAGPPDRIEAVQAAVAANGAGGARALAACPQMHATGLFVTMWTMLTGGCVVTVDGDGSFDADAIWRTAAATRTTSLAIVGDAFARPLLRALDDSPGRHDLSALQMIGSSGAMWSEAVKRRLLEHLSHVQLVDVFASTESMGLGASVMTAAAGVATARFMPGPDVIVIDDEDRPFAHGAECTGRLAVGGAMQPLGYYKDPDKTARAFKTIDGKRYSVPGDYVRRDAAGGITLLGRGSSCINSGGEKIYPEEVEEAIKTDPGVEDALVIGVPDEKWGQAVTAVVRLAAGASFDEARLRAHVRGQLAGYKAPKRIVATDGSLRFSNGKADYAAAGAIARRALDLPD